MHICRLAVLAPLCLIAPGVQAKAGADRGDWRRPFLDLLLTYRADIIPYGCTEVSFGGLSHGLARKPHGIEYYSRLSGYKEHCRQQAVKTEEIAVGLAAGGYCLAAILGIEHSPSCAVSYIYSNRGMLKRPGIFIEFLREEPICGSLPYIGINKRFPRKSLACLQARLESCREQLGGNDK